MLAQPAYFSATNALALITTNLSLGALVTHVGLWHWQDLKPFVMSLNPWNKSPYLVQDAHWEKMKVYKQIPKWWYIVVLLGAYGIAQPQQLTPSPTANYTGKSSLPWWALTVILMIGFFFCSLYATPVATIGFTGNAIGFFEMITGACVRLRGRINGDTKSCPVAYLVPGNPVANMYGALYGG
ncbi:hypothetical protein AcV5_002621 [Taiwanofungus camphoratus]|nr:hypothetical protein AcV5_002621 [Antrodia cinnamomea]